MTWREAFLAQAWSDAAVRRLLNRERSEYSHQLHYLQMTTEKLAKAQMAPADDTPPPLVHAVFVRFLQVLKQRPDLRRKLGFENMASFRAFIDSLLPLAAQIERLAPNLAGIGQPNPEYPWQPALGHEVIAPSQFAFSDFDPRQPQMIKLVSLVESLLKTIN